jgi:hypothetical protein
VGVAGLEGRVSPARRSGGHRCEVVLGGWIREVLGVEKAGVAYGGPLPRCSSSWEVLQRMHHGVVVRSCWCSSSAGRFDGGGCQLACWPDADLVKGVLEAWVRPCLGGFVPGQ